MAAKRSNNGDDLSDLIETILLASILLSAVLIPVINNSISNTESIVLKAILFVLGVLIISSNILSDSREILSDKKFLLAWAIANVILVVATKDWITPFVAIIIALLTVICKIWYHSKIDYRLDDFK